MKPLKLRLRRILIITLSVIVGVVVLCVAFISPISKYLIEKYSVKYTGRQIKMAWLYVNPFTGHVHFSKLKIYEQKSDIVFFSANGLTVDMDVRKLLSKEYIFTRVTIDEPYGVVVLKDKSTFNFTDIVEFFSSPIPEIQKLPKPPGEPAHFSILNVTIKNGTFYFYDTLIKVNYFIKNFNFKSPGMTWKDMSFQSDVSFDPGTGTGHITGKYWMNVSTVDYNYSLKIQHLNMSVLDQYLRSISNYGTFSAFLDADISTKGNYKNAEESDTKGRILVNDFHFGKNKIEDYLSFDTLVLAMNEVYPKKHLYNLDSIKLSHPYFKYESYDHLDNVQTMFGKAGANVAAANTDLARFNLVIALAHYIEDLSRNFFESAYKVNKLEVNRADLKFNDYSVSDKFSMEANPLYVKVDSIDKNKGLVNVRMTSGLKPYGNFAVVASINPRDSANFVLHYHIENVPLSAFNPYLITYTSFPLDRGTLELNGTWNVQQGIIQSDNHLLMVDPFIDNKIKNKGLKWLPMWLVLAFTRNNGNVIDYQIPITGNLKSPTFHLKNVFLDILTNIFVKPPATPYRIKVKALENEIENSLSLKWEMRQSQMSSSQKKFAKKMADFLSKTPEASVQIYPQQFEIKEKEYILLYEAKKKYYMSCHPNRPFEAKDSELVEKMSVKDSSFVRYLNKYSTGQLLFTVQDKCSNIVGAALVNARFNQLNAARKEAFMSYFKEKGIADKVKFFSAKNYIPYNGFSFYKVEYKGAYPAYVLKAYQKMDRLNHEAPREKYNKDRTKIGAI